MRGLAASSEQARIVYFVADAVYDTAPNPQGELPAEGEPNLYMAKLGADFDGPIELRFIATLGVGDGAVWKGSLDPQSAYASPDGSVLGFGSRQPLTGQPTAGTEQMFVYDAEPTHSPAPPVPPTARCRRATSSAGHRPLRAGNGHRWQQHSFGVLRWVSSRGVVFFDTPTSLLPADQNGHR